MKSTGIVRKVDELGACNPIELRRTYRLKKDALEIYVDGERIILRSINCMHFL